MRQKEKERDDGFIKNDGVAAQSDNPASSFRSKSRETDDTGMVVGAIIGGMEDGSERGFDWWDYWFNVR